MEEKNNPMENLVNSNSPISKELIDLLIKKTQQSTEQSTLIRTALLDLKEKFDDIAEKNETLTENYKKILEAVDDCPVRKDDLAIHRVKVDVENIKLNMTDFRKESRDFMESIDASVLQPYLHTGGVRNFFSNLFRKYMFYLVIFFVILQIIEILIFVFYFPISKG